jgi:hypothetical protein
MGLRVLIAVWNDVLQVGVEVDRVEDDVREGPLHTQTADFRLSRKAN